MEKKDLQKLLSQPYKQDNWKQIVQFVFPNVSILSIPKEFPINNEKIKKFRQIGSVRLNDGKNLALFELLLADTVNIQRNRVELNNEISKYIDQEQIHGVLSVFEQGTDDYRFTFSARSTEFDEEESDFVQKKTDTKRYTYVLGKNESCKTPADRFYKLSENKSEVDINAIQNAFSVEQLSKEFFDKYKKQFEKFWKYIASKEEYKGVFINGQGEREVKIRNFTKKLLGRIVFLHFLQKKGWMGCPEQELWGAGDKKFMQNLFKDFTHKEQFHSKCLVELFYNTLNAKRDDQLFSCEGLEGALNNSKVPYLNGGLFDSDQLESTKIDFPESYFEDLFDFFGQYNFTIDENDPNDHEVGIDPEMLGHIFENLLEDNKDKGAFYTPKVIVQYMCQESLIEYLATKLNAESSGEVKQAIEDLIRNRLAEDISDLDLVEPVAQALFDVKICDPAIGSGAFPMGILNVIYQVIEALYYLQRDSVARVWNISDTQWQPHLVKKNIIQHSIYGVDIESGAVDIARLRFWLALVVDEVEPLPLPNLDYKIMQGNSLLESFEGIDLSEISDAAAYEAVYESEQIDIFSGEAKKKVRMSLQFEDVKTLMDDYFNANDPETKKDLHKRIDEQVLNHIRFTFAERKRDLQKKAKKLEKKVSLDEAAARTSAQVEKIRTNSKASKALKKLNTELSQYNDKELKLALLSSSNERPFFLWHLFFQEVFDKGGFDIVIANPPYVGVKGNSSTFDLVKTGRFSKYSKGRAELFYYFFHLAIEILKNGGTSCFITTNYFTTATDANLLRAHLKDSTTLLKFLNFNELSIFSTAPGQHNAITLFKKGKYQKNLFAVDSNSSGQISDGKFQSIVFGKDINSSYYKTSQDEIFEGEESYIRIKGVFGSNPELKRIYEKFNSCPRLEKLAHVRQGLRTGIDKISDSHRKKYNTSHPKGIGVFIVSKTEREQANLENDIVKDLYKNSDIDHYLTCKGSDLFLLYVDKSLDENSFKKTYPNSYNHLLKFQDIIKDIRSKNNEDVKDWYTLDRPRERWIFEKEKVVAPQRSKKNKFGYSYGNFYASADVYYIIPHDSQVSAKYLTVLLNSSIYYFWFYNKGKRKGNMLELYQKPLSEAPIFISSRMNKYLEFFELVKERENLQSDMDELLQKIDAFICRDFNFTFQEYKLICGSSLTITENEFNSINID